MANLDRDGFVTELQVRGWSRFTSVQLQKYLDWALQDIYGMARFPRSTLGVSTISGTVLDIIPFATISGGGGELVHQVKGVQVKYSGEVMVVDPASEVDYMEFMYPNTQATNPVLAAYPVVYFISGTNLYLYPKPQAAVDLFIHRLLREDVFTGGTDVTGLPERFDKAVLAQTETICNRRAHDPEGYAIAQACVRDFMLDELGLQGEQMEEQYDRVVPWRG